jgi:hypothetical protein
MARQNRKGGEDSELVNAFRKRVRKSVQVTEEMPLKLKENEGKEFVVSIAVSRNRLIEFLKKDTVSQGVLGVRRIEDQDRDTLEDSQDRDEDSDRWNE